MKALVLIGPTGAGKSDLALELAQDRFQIVSVDSVQIYKYLNIGSGKLLENERQGIPHYLIDFLEPSQPFSAGDFCREADLAVNKIKQSNALPLFVGGTGLYVDAYFQGLSDIPLIDPCYRVQFEEQKNEKGLQYLYEQLQQCDPLFAQNVHPNDQQRIIRGLEVFAATKKPLSLYYAEKKGRESEETVYLGLDLERSNLYRKIEKRIDKMIEMGFIDEVDWLLKQGYNPEEHKVMRSIGYFELIAYLRDECSKEDAISHVKHETKRYAKRQISWFKRNSKINWIVSTDYDNINKIVETLF